MKHLSTRTLNVILWVIKLPGLRRITSEQVLDIEIELLGRDIARLGDNHPTFSCAPISGQN